MGLGNLHEDSCDMWGLMRTVYFEAQIYRHLVGGAPPVAGRLLSRLLQEDLARDFQAWQWKTKGRLLRADS